jgi:hypothetical protein
VLRTPHFEWDTTYAEILVERSEAESHGYEAGQTVWLEHGGLGLAGWVQVTAVAPADIEQGEGCLVVGTTTHESGELVRLRLTGSDDEVVVTRTHPIWSVSRDEWIPAAQLELGEVVTTAEGPATVASLEALYELAQVYNFEVEGAHEYLVGEAGLRAHNGGPCPPETIGGGFTDEMAEAWAEGSLPRNHRGEVVRVPSGHVMSPRDLPLSEPPIFEAGPFTTDQRGGFLSGTGGGTRLSPHHRHQIPVSHGSVIDELPGPGHPSGNVHTGGSPTRHPGPSVFRGMPGGEALRSREIVAHWQQKGGRLVEVAPGVWVDPGPL